MKPIHSLGRWHNAIAFLFLLVLANCAPWGTLSLPPQLNGASIVEPTVPPAEAESDATPNLPATAVAVKTPSAQEIFRSPDGKWQVHINVRSCLETPSESELGYDELRVTDLATGDELLADQQVIHCGGLGAYGLKGYGWSDNSRYFYHTSAREGVPDGGGVWNGPYLYFDTETLSTVNLGGAVPSSDGKFILIVQAEYVLLWDRNAGEIARHTLGLKTQYPGKVAWSPDGLALAVLQTSGAYPPGDSFLTVIRLPAFDQMYAANLAEGDFQSLVWDKPSELRLFKFPANQEWIFSLETRELSAASPPSQDSVGDSK